jgi:hypothetical protein
MICFSGLAVMPGSASFRELCRSFSFESIDPPADSRTVPEGSYFSLVYFLLIMPTSVAVGMVSEFSASLS